MSKVTKKYIKDTISDLMSDFFYYERKEDDKMPVGAMEDAVRAGVMTEQEVLTCFQVHIIKGLQFDKSKDL